MIKIYRCENGYIVKTPVFRSTQDPMVYEQSGETETYYEFLDDIIVMLKKRFRSEYEKEQKEQELRRAESILLNKIKEKE